MECICIPAIIPIGAVHEANAIPLAPVDVAATMTTAHVLNADIAESAGDDGSQGQRSSGPGKRAESSNRDDKKEKLPLSPQLKPVSSIAADARDSNLEDLRKEMMTLRRREMSPQGPILAERPIPRPNADMNFFSWLAPRIWLAAVLVAFLAALIQRVNS